MCLLVGDEAQVAPWAEAVAGELSGGDPECPVGVNDDVEATVGVGARGAAREVENSRACVSRVAAAWSFRGRARADTVLTTTSAVQDVDGRRRRSTTTRSEAGSWVVSRVHTEEVTGSIPVSPTDERPGQELLTELRTRSFARSGAR
jgi:hypothetical protein